MILVRFSLRFARMSQGPSPPDFSNMAMDPTAMYYSAMHGIPSRFSTSQVNWGEHSNKYIKKLTCAQMGNNGQDTSMTDMLEGYDGMPITLDVNSLEEVNSDGRIYKPSSPGIQQQQTPGQIEDPRTVDRSMVGEVMSGVGAGPLPTGFGVQSTISGGSTLTEFTKRRNWPQRVVEELKDFLHILTPDGRIVYISPSGKQLTGYPQEELVGRFIVDFIHPDDSGIFVREFNESIASGHPLRFFYRFRKQDGEYTIFESHGHPHLTSEAAVFGSHNASGFCRGFFMMARPYPTKNAALLDSFLEQKMENERLTRRIAELRREEAEEMEDGSGSWVTKKQEGRSDMTMSEDNDMLGSTSTRTAIPRSPINPDILAMPPPAKPSVLNNALTRQNLEDANAISKPDSINDKMARYEGANHIDSIEMLTGLRYQDGERSHGISTGDMSPALIRGDAGIAIPVDKEGRDKKKKIKVAEEYVCTDCGKSPREPTICSTSS